MLFIFLPCTHCPTAAHFLYGLCSSLTKANVISSNAEGSTVASAPEGPAQEDTTTTAISTCRLSVLGGKILSTLSHGSSSQHLLLWYLRNYNDPLQMSIKAGVTNVKPKLHNCWDISLIEVNY